MLKPQGYAQILDPDLPRDVEWDTITCIHCQTVVRVKPGTVATVYLVWDGVRWIEEMGAMCARCNKPVCLACHDIGSCPGPWEKQMERIEAIARQRR